MDYAELKLYDLQGDDIFTKKHVETLDKPSGQTLNSNDRNILSLYKKRIIEQRERIQELEEEVRKLKGK